MTKDALYAGFAIFLTAEILFVIVAVAWETLKKRREARAKGSWGWMIGQAVGGYTEADDDTLPPARILVPVADWEAVRADAAKWRALQPPAESLGRAE